MYAKSAIRIAAAALMLLGCGGLGAQQAPPSQAPAVLDRVVAVVNNHAILASDIESELKLSVLDGGRGRGRRTGGGERHALTARSALQLLISRALIQQQIGQANMQVPPPTDEDVHTRMQQMREQLPICVEAHCTTDAGWDAFLQENGLTENEVANYLRLRMEVLSFIELRFRQGIQITQEQIEKYYKETLLPQYPKGETPPTVDVVSQRIQEILLQQQVNELFGAWLADLRKQGDVEVLDPTLEPPTTENGGGR